MIVFVNWSDYTDQIEPPSMMKAISKWEPDAVTPRVRVCAGAAGNRRRYRDDSFTRFRTMQCCC